MRQEDESTTSYDRRSIPKHRVFMFLDARFLLFSILPQLYMFCLRPKRCGATLRANVPHLDAKNVEFLSFVGQRLVTECLAV
jgi:hypothetical protein